MVWGESNSREFLDWADFCRNNALRTRGITNTGGPNFTSDRSSPQYQATKQQLLDIIQKSRTISVQQLYNSLPTNLVSNPTVKHVLLQLYYEDNLTIQSQSKSTSDRETNFVVTFVKKATPPKPSKPNFQGERKQSNIEDLIDNSWSATGRKLSFDKLEKPKRENLNISLKRNSTPTVNMPGEKPVIDVRKKVDSPKVIQPVVITTPNKADPPVVEQNFTYIEIPKPKPEVQAPEPVAPVVQINPVYRPPVKEEVYIEDRVFAGLTDYELYYLAAFLRDAAKLEKARNSYIDSTRDLVYTKADIQYLNNKEGSNIGLKIVGAVLCIVIIGIFILISASKNKIKAKATKDYFKELKNVGYDDLKVELKSKYPKIIEF
ncbi:hypothetical protein [Spiroplasma tabanidicola]|uniref:Uncharacterized protein n=1 Tax=Spiroplasma tabanidicola TaxID=324079 RepID=A0A6I6C652_9MOLU|nr:hypothetical protein [Spiroplasma tabanidicola]QGS52407.1 hypothetical protein STABA_v1c10590 [Spiroplasma tabanidicola]